MYRIKVSYNGELKLEKVVKAKNGWHAISIAKHIAKKRKLQATLYTSCRA